MEGWIMSDIRTSALGGIPFGDNSGRPTGTTGQPYFNGEVGRLELYTAATGWQNIVQETPGVSSIVGTYLESAGYGTITISGTNFVSGCYATAIGSNGVQVDATSTTFNSIVQVSATFTGLSAEFEPYDIKVTNPSNLFGMIPDALYINQSPIWSTPSGTIGTVLERDLIAFQFVATDPEGGNITFASSNIPSGLSLTSSGILSGVAPSVSSNTTYNFNITATDGANTAVSRAFSITVNYLSAVELLLVGGGGGGGGTVVGHHEAAGGGGAGGLYYNATMPITGSHLVTVGSGGSGGAGGSAGTTGYTGENSVFGTKIALGGGAGGGQYANPSSNGINGGSGGGWCGHAGFGRSTNTGLQSSSETGGLGNAGGQATAGGAYGGGGGGGSAGGGNNNSGQSGGQGGPGSSYSITGAAQFYAAGGGGAAQSGSSGGAGGSGIGGNGSSGTGSAGSTNTGSGGGGGGAASGGPGGAGGSGVVIFAVPGTHTAQNIPGTLTYTRDTTTRAGHTVYRFTAGSGTITL
jgi:hypothetical protein